ncbi:trypsin-like peptidase domain-containing protein [Planktomarina temperata]|nr:trypsin-like peptidase domain-containing protein [Planktomarina temperata]
MEQMFKFCAMVAILAIGIASFGTSLLSQELVTFDRSSFGSVVISKNQSVGNDIQLELAIGNYENEPIINYSVGSVFAQMGRSVGRLDVLTDKGMFPCTAFIVSPKYILTNYHCSLGLLDNEQINATRIDATQFVAGYIQTGIEEGTNKYTVIPTPIEISKDLDYAVLEVIGNPAEKYGKLKLSDIAPAHGDPFWIIGHPMGEGQRISREKCKANNPALSAGKLLHTCDTLPGNSGSPVIDAGLQQVVALHHAGSRADSVNFAILMSDILQNSKILTAFEAPIALPQAITEKPKVCDELYNAAAKAKACYAYDAYIKSCNSHSLVPLARGYLNEFCNEAVEPVVEDPVLTLDDTSNEKDLFQSIKYDDGSSYEGHVFNGQKNGAGTFVSPSGTVYSGEWKNGQMSGKGTATYSDGSIYEGIFSAGRPNGLGTITYSDGSTYSGNWQNGEINGAGKVVYSNGLTYDGNFKSSLHHGQGVLTSKTGYKYDGSWVNGAFHGLGTLVYSDKSTYIGSFVAGQRSGYGVLTDLAGGERAGVWVNDQFPGDTSTNDVSSFPEIDLPSTGINTYAPARSLRPLKRPKPIELAALLPKPVGAVTAALDSALKKPRLNATDLSPDGTLPFGLADSISGVQLAIAECWNLGALSSAALSTTVAVEMELTLDGKPVPNSIKMLGFEGGDEISAEQAFETALRAIQVCGAQGFDLPRDKYESWRRVELIFNPEKTRLR